MLFIYINFDYVIGKYLLCIGHKTIHLIGPQVFVFTGGGGRKNVSSNFICLVGGVKMLLTKSIEGGVVKTSPTFPFSQWGK